MTNKLPPEIAAQIAKLSPEQKALFEKKIKQQGLNNLKRTSIPRREITETAPLSFAQQRLWFIQQLEPDNNSYNVPCALRLKGELNVAVLERTLNQICQRHEVFRTTFITTKEKQPLSIIAPYQPFPLPIIELRGIDYQETEIHTIIKEKSQEPFDLTKPLLRLDLLHLDEAEYILLIVTHHIISDRWSIGVFLREMTLLYQGLLTNKDFTLPELPIQYGDWAYWQRENLQEEKLTEQIDYWQQQLGESEVIELPTDKPRPAVPSYQGEYYPLSLPKSLSEELKSLSATEGVTLFNLLLTAFGILLHRYTDEDYIVVGTDIANREAIETEGLIGLLVNTLVLRTNFSGNPTFREMLARVREVLLGAYSHQDLPFEKLVEVLNPERNLSQMMPLFQVKFDFQLANVKPLQLPGLQIERLPFDEPQIKYELRFNLQDTESGITGQVEYSTDLFSQATIARMVEHFQVLLTGIVANPEACLSQLPIISQEEQQWLFSQGAGDRRDYSNYTFKNMIEPFEEQVKRIPQAVAIIDGERQLTYQELSDRSEQLADYLQERGVKLGTKIGIYLERSLEMIVSLLAILKAGGTYVPLDMAYPDERLVFILEDAQVELLIVQEYSENHSIQRGDSQKYQIISLDAIATSTGKISVPLRDCQSLAYIIYTSGSTGKPKGVAIEHGSVLELLYWAKEVFSADALSGVLASTSICFDLSVFEIFVPLSWGGKVILAENALTLPELKAANQVTLINTVPSAIAQLLRVNAIPPSVNTINLAGEALPPRLIQQLEAKEHIKSIYNLYGPSEDTTYSTYALVGGNNSSYIAQKESRINLTSVAIGKPINNTQAYVLDRYLQPVPKGVIGELYLGGKGLAQGYFNRSELTAEKFIAFPNNIPPFQSESPLTPPFERGVGGGYKTPL